MICTRAEDFQGNKSGTCSEEVLGPFYTFTSKGCKVTTASIKGGKVPIDTFSLGEGFKTENDTKFESTGDVKKLESSVAVSMLSPGVFDCIFLTGRYRAVVNSLTSQMALPTLSPRQLQQARWLVQCAMDLWACSRQQSTASS